MKKFLSGSLVFIIIGMLIGECTIRVFNLYIDVPTMHMNKFGLIKSDPNQEGLTYWGHKWIVNSFGEYGYEPQNIDSIFTVIGDSYIANTINPPECHQAKFLSLHFDSIDFYPAARGGAGFLEFIVMANSLNNLEPIQHLLYVHDGDFTESIIEIENNSSKLQWSFEKKKIRNPVFNKNEYKLKRILYQSKLAYYIYRNYVIKKNPNNTNNRDNANKEIDYLKIQELLKYIEANFDTHNITLIFSPDSDQKLTSLVKKYNYKVFTLKTKDYKSWQLENDSHWSCYGHEQVSSQVAKFIKATNWK